MRSQSPRLARLARRQPGWSRASLPIASFGVRVLIAVAAGALDGCVHFHPQPIEPQSALAVLESRSLTDPSLTRYLEASGQLGSSTPGIWDLRALTLAAFYYHPDLDVARSQWAAARAAIRTAGGRPDPTVSPAIGYNSTTPVADVTPWILTLNLDFTIETGGKRGYRIAQARQLSEAARLEIASAGWRVRSRVRRSLLDMYAASGLTRLFQRQDTIQQRNVTLMERQLAAGAISPFELSQARLLGGASRLALYDAQQQEAEARVALAAAVGVTVGALDSVRLGFEAFEGMPAELPATEVRRRALLNRPDVLGALHRYEASQAALQLEVARQYPDLHLGPGYQLDQANTKWTLGLGGLLPIFNRNRGPIAEAAARREEAAAAFIGVQSAAIEQIDGAVAAFTAARAKLVTADSLYGDRLALQRVADEQYNAGQISRLELGSTQFELATAEIARSTARVILQRVLGQLEDAMQSPIVPADWLLTAPRRPSPTGSR